MTGVYTQYFQKSKVFLYPLLKLKKGIDYVPEQTYIAWDGLYSPEDMKFLCLYNAKMDDKYIRFESRYIKSHPLLEAYFSLGDDQHLYVFDYSSYKYDYQTFIKGKYSKFSIKVKEIIGEFFGKVGNISDYVMSFLNPDEFHELYAEALGVDINLIIKVHELCSPPDLEKETLSKKVPQEVELFKNNSISLNKL
jgi:hypothetical protein